MEAFYIKQKTTYLNGDKTPFSFIRIEDGIITVISIARNSLSHPKTWNINKGFITISKEEFEKELNKILNGLD